MRETQVDSLPFVMSEEIAVTYGRSYSVSPDEKGIPEVKAGGHAAAREGVCG